MPSRRTALVLLLALIVTVSLTAGLLKASTVQSQDVNVYINGVQTLFPDQLPYIDDNNRTMVPVRFCSLALGATVEVEFANQTGYYHPPGERD